MKRYSIVHPLVLSFFSKDLYEDVARNWKGTGFLYLFMLLTICWIPTMTKMAAGFSKFVAKEAPRYLDQVPDITIKDGKVSINEPMPYFIKDPDSGDTFVILDTTGQTTSLEGSKAFLLLTKTKLTVKQNARETRAYDLSGIKNFTLTKERLHDWLDIGRKLLVSVLFPICVLGSYVYRIVQALIYAAIGLIFASSLKAALDYLALLRLSVIAVTPAVILDTLLNLAGKHVPAWGFICLLIAMGYLFLGVKASAATAQPPPTPSPAPPTA
jgi:hypothetical protein